MTDRKGEENMIKVAQLIVLLGLIIVLQGCGGSDGDSFGIDTSGRGCGSGWNTDVVRDEFWDVSFNEPCKHHDICYETCGVTKEECDDTFHDELKNVCEVTYPDASDEIQKTACLGAALVYYEGVKNAGEGAFSDAQKNCR